MYDDLHKLDADEILRRLIQSGAQPGSPFFELHKTALDRALVRESAQNSVKSAA